VKQQPKDHNISKECLRQYDGYMLILRPVTKDSRMCVLNSHSALSRAARTIGGHVRIKQIITKGMKSASSAAPIEEQRFHFLTPEFVDTLNLRGAWLIRSIVTSSVSNISAIAGIVSWSR
jgi:hypothetical protein